MSNTIYSDKIKVNCPLIHDENGYYHLVYKVTNIVNGKIYIGKHSTKNPYDRYMGSGKRILLVLKKYGIKNFTKEILFCFDKEDDAFLKEEEIVTEEFVNRDDTYNMVLGGNGFKSGESNPIFGKYGKNCPTSGEKNGMYGKKHSQDTRNKISNALSGEKSPWYGKHLPKETKDKISKANTGKKRDEIARKNISKNHADVSGEKNPMYGRRGIDCPNYGEKNGMYGKKHSQEARDKMTKNSAHAKTILKLDEFGNIVAEYGCMKECCAQERFCRDTLKRLINNHILHNGFYFEYKSNH